MSATKRGKTDARGMFGKLVKKYLELHPHLGKSPPASSLDEKKKNWDGRLRVDSKSSEVLKSLAPRTKGKKKKFSSQTEREWRRPENARWVGGGSSWFKRRKRSRL